MSLSKARSNSAETPAAKILLVDESRMGVAARRTILREAGCEVFTASNTADGLEQISRHDIQVLVTEFKIAEQSGLAFIRSAREQNPNLGVIVLSCFTDALGLHESNTGADIVLQKNSNEVAQLVRGVKRLLSRKPARKPAAKAKGMAKSTAAGKR